MVQASPRPPPRCLIVEDEALIALLLEDLLASFGYEVIASVPTAEEAIEGARMHRPDIVLTDLTLRGELGGVEAAEAIRAGSDCAILFVTAHDDSEMLERMRRIPRSAILAKPLNEGALRAAVEQLLIDRTG